MDEAALIEALRSGDGQAFETLVRTYGGRLMSIARRMLHDEDDAREVVQAAFVAAFQNRASLPADSSISTWLHTIAVKTALQKLHDRPRMPEEAVAGYLPRFLPGGVHAETFAPWPERVEVALAHKEVAQQVREDIETLPETYRTTLLLRDVEGMSREETATIVDTTPNAVKIRLHRGRMALRTLIARRLTGDPS